MHVRRLSWLLALVLLTSCTTRDRSDDDDDDTSEPTPPPSPFWITLETDECDIVRNTLVFRDPDTGDVLDSVPHFWPGCSATWAGDARDETSGLTLLLMAPNTSGSIPAPGTRWLKLSMLISRDDERSLPAQPWDAEYDRETWSTVVYVDTDDADETFEFDGDVGVAWADASGSLGSGALDGEIYDNPEPYSADDEGTFTITFDLSGIDLILRDGQAVDVEGEVEISGAHGGPVVDGPDWGSCPSLAGESCVAMNLGQADDPTQAAADFAASCALSNDGDQGAYQEGHCPTSGSVARCDDATGTLEATGDVVPIEVVWYPAGCGLNMAGTCSSLGGTFDDLGGCN